MLFIGPPINLSLGFRIAGSILAFLCSNLITMGASTFAVMRIYARFTGGIEAVTTSGGFPKVGG
jgi:hypothetical protein